MAEYKVNYQIRIPTSRNPQTGAVKYVSDGSAGRSVTIKASSPEEARKLAAKNDAINQARSAAAKRVDYDMPKPRVKILDIKPRGGGAIEQDPLAVGKRGISKLPRKMNKGGYVSKAKKK